MSEEDEEKQTEPRRYRTAMTDPLRRAILRSRGQNSELSRDIELLPPASQKRLYRVIEGLREDADRERRNARRFGLP